MKAQTLIVFGATGNLAQSMLLPSLFALHADGLLAPAFTILGTARSPHDDESYRNLSEHALRKYLPANRNHPAIIAEFLRRLRYRALDTSAPEEFNVLAAALGDAPQNVAIFLSTAPALFEPTIVGLRAAGLTDNQARIALEKPLGENLASSCQINDAVTAVFPESRIYRIDHYLGKETVQNLLALRFANILLEPLWHAATIDHVQITVAEALGLEGRVGYYDQSGALRDMVQNHLLQLLALVAMEPPAHFSAAAVRDEKVKVLRSLRPIDRSNVATHCVIGQYGAGAQGGSLVPGYIDELGHPSNAETFVALKAHIDNWRWKGVPFYLRTGKRMPSRRSEIFIQFKAVPHSIFAGRGEDLKANKLTIMLQPDEQISLQMMTKVPGLDRDGIHFREVPLDLSLGTAFVNSPRRIAYERLLLDFIEGDQTLFVRRDEVEAQWAWVDQIRDGWAATEMTPKLYAAGTWGPSAAIALTERNGVSWHD